MTSKAVGHPAAEIGAETLEGEGGTRTPGSCILTGLCLPVARFQSSPWKQIDRTVSSLRGSAASDIVSHPPHRDIHRMTPQDMGRRDCMSLSDSD